MVCINSDILDEFQKYSISKHKSISVSMGFGNFLKSFILRLDLFATPACLRYKGEPYFETIQCGIFSFLLIGIFVAYFASPVLQIFQKVDITSSTTVNDALSSENTVSQIKFAVGIGSLTLEEMRTHFQFQVKRIYKNLGNSEYTSIYLQPCQISSWESESDNMKKYYDGINMAQTLCSPTDFDLSLLGYEGNWQSSQVELKISRCKNFSTCSDTATFDTFVSNHLDQNDYFKVRLFILDTIFQLELDKPVAPTLNRDMFLSFTDVLGSRGHVDIATYEITTDQSIWPFQSNVVETGSFVQKFDTVTTGIRSDRFVSISFEKSTLEYQSIRSYGKIDDILSYIGGLFPLIFVVLAFICGAFNDYRYQLMVGQRILSFNGEKNNDVKESDMTIFGYIKYSLYDWLLLFGISLQWESVKNIHRIREQTNQQLDICTVMKKLQYLQNVLQLTIQKQFLACANLIPPNTLQQSIQKRKMIQYYYILHSNQQEEYYKNAQQSAVHTQSANHLREDALRYNDMNLSPDLHTDQSKGKKLSNIPKILQNQFEMLRINNLRQIREKQSGKIKVETSAEQKQRKKGCCLKCCDWFSKFFDDDIDSDDEEAERRIFEEYMKIKQQRIKIDKIPPYFQKLIVKEALFKKNGNTNRTIEIKDMK